MNIENATKISVLIAERAKLTNELTRFTRMKPFDRIDFVNGEEDYLPTDNEIFPVDPVVNSYEDALVKRLHEIETLIESLNPLL